MRESIFKKLEENFDYNMEMRRIEELFNSNLFYTKSGYTTTNYTPEEYVDRGAFGGWKSRNRCINTKDMKLCLDIDAIQNAIKGGDKLPIEDMFIYLEYVINILYVGGRFVHVKEKHYGAGYDDTCNTLHENINTFLNHINHETYTIKEEEKTIIVEKSPQATAVAEIVDEALGISIIQYNHYLLKGNIHKKLSILRALHNGLEHKREELKVIDKNLEDNIFYLFNNLDIRHNNKDESKKYKEYVANMDNKEYETWLDETYQFILLAFLQLDNKERLIRFKELKSKIEAKDTNKELSN